MTQEADHDKMERGRRAAAIEALVKPLVLKKVEDIILQLCAFYRGGTMSNDFARGKIAEISVLYELMSMLESAQRQGDAAAQRELGNAPERSQTHRSRT